MWEQLEPSLAAIDVPSKRIDLEGYPPDLLPDYAHKVGADLVVVGTRGRGNFASLILGSTSHRTIQVAGCDVLVVNPQAG
jgi:nucleotide-binding universal stress UspA family protein